MRSQVLSIRSTLWDTSFIVFPESTVEPTRLLPPPPTHTQIWVKTTYLLSKTVQRAFPSPTHPSVMPSIPLSSLSSCAVLKAPCKEAQSEPLAQTLVMELIKINVNCMFKFIFESKRHFFHNIVLYCFHCKCLFAYNECSELHGVDLGINHCL